ncbi:MAG: biotin synthase BioB [Desulfococcaceae bacterium]
MNVENGLNLADRIAGGEEADPHGLYELAEIPETAIFDLLPGADRLRRHYFRDRIRMCGILNAKSGRCSEDCGFCAQSGHAETDAPIYPLMSAESIREAAERAADQQLGRFSVVTTGRRLPREEVAAVAEAIAGMPAGMGRCASLGILETKDFEILRKAGVTRYHHNLETAESHFPAICTTHAYPDRVDTIRAAHKAGMSVCSGGIFGLGETDAQVVELALTLRNLPVTAAPVNFLVPAPGTKMEGAANLTPLRCLKILALLRFTLPNREIIVCGGRTANLGELHPMIFYAGANGLMTGDYLTTSGRSPEADRALLRSLGLRVAGTESAIWAIGKERHELSSKSLKRYTVHFGGVFEGRIPYFLGPSGTTTHLKSKSGRHHDQNPSFSSGYQKENP